MKHWTLQLPVSPERNARIAIVGDAPSSGDRKAVKPFSDTAGKELTHMLAEAGIIREECLLTYVFPDIPPKGTPYSWCMKKKEADAAWQALGNQGKYPLSPIKSGNYLDPKVLGHIPRLHKELVAFNPNIIITMGNFATWALIGDSGIGKLRGTLVEASLGGPRAYKVLPTLDPAAIIAQWQERPVMVADLMKAKRESFRPDYDRPSRELWLGPCLADLQVFYEKHIAKSHSPIAVDIETQQGQITCIGLGTTEAAICIPFWNVGKEGWSHWETLEEEVEALRWIKGFMESDIPKLFQNGMYDMQWLLRKYGIKVMGEVEDTMLLAHSMFPEMRKGLGFLGSIYTNEPAWKKLRPKKTTEGKKDDE